MIKKQLKLLSNAGNYFDLPQSTIDAYMIDSSQMEKISDITRLFLNKTKGHFSYDIIKRQLDKDFANFQFVRMPKYPLPAAFNVKTRKLIINVNSFGRRDVLNIDPRDMYSVLVYGYVCAYYTSQPLKDAYADDIADYMSAIFIKLFAKKYGLIGSYVDEIPKLRFLVNVHVYVSYFGMSQKVAYGRAGNLAKIRKSNFDIELDEYDFSDTKQLIKVLSESGVLHGISVYEFASTIVRIMNTSALAMFEDGMRFMATIGASSVTSTTLFPVALEKYNPKLYRKITDVLEKSIK